MADWFEQNQPDWFDKNKPNTPPPDSRNFLQKAWDWTGKALLPISKVTEPYLKKDSIPIGSGGQYGQIMAMMRPDESLSQANPGVIHGMAKAMEGMTSPRSVAMAAALPATLGMGQLGMINAATLATDTGIKSYQAFQDAKNLQGNEKTAAQTEAGLDAAMALLFAREGARRSPKVATKPSLEPAKAKLTSVRPQEALKPTAPALDTPIVEQGPQQPWYIKNPPQTKANVPVKPSAKAPEFSSPAAYPEEFPYGHTEPEVRPMVRDMVNYRMKSAVDLFTQSGLGELSGKFKPVEGIENMSYGAAQGEKQGYGKINVKSIFPELEGVKGTPKAIVDAIKRDKNNKKYLEIKDRMTEQIFRENADQIDNLNEDALYKREERRGLEEGFADIQDKHTKRLESIRALQAKMLQEKSDSRRQILAHKLDRLRGDNYYDEPVSSGKGEEGFADTKDQKGFSFVPLDIKGQSKKQALNELYNQILQADDSNVSKKDLLGISKKKKGTSPDEAPLFQPKGLF